MPVQTTVETDANIVIHTVTVSLSLEEITSTLDALLENPDFQPTMNTLWDIREANVAEWSVEGVQTVVSHVGTHAGQRGSHYKSAIVTARNVDFGLSRMYEAYGHGLPLTVRVFRDMNGARKWVCPATWKGKQSDVRGNNS
jgi:hypothetical protein